jgi:sugar phosphate isomerase/epimerase
MKYVYFTKTLQKLTVAKLIDFVKDAGLDGVDLAVRPGYPVTPDNAAIELPKTAKAFAEAGQIIGLVTAPTGLTDAASKQAVAIFEACGAAGVPNIKIGYFGYRAPFDACLKEARAKMEGFARLAERTKVKACYHTHSGSNLGNNAASLRLLLEGFDPHHVGAFVDTGHTAVNGGPAALELDTVRPWLSLIAIKDMQFTKGRSSRVVPVGGGIVQWGDVAAGLKACKFNGTVSVHGEYEAKDYDERLALAKKELTALKKAFGG